MGSPVREGFKSRLIQEGFCQETSGSVIGVVKTGEICP